MLNPESVLLITTLQRNIKEKGGTDVDPSGQNVKHKD